MMYFLSVVLIGTVYPIFLEVIANEKISVGPPFYNKLLIPFLIPFLFFMSIGPSMKWIRHNIKLINVRLILLFLLSSFVSYLILIRADLNTLFTTVLLVVSIYLFFITVRDFFIKNQKNFSQIKEGDYVSLTNVGAYGMSLSSNYNTRPTIAEIMVNGSKHRVIRKRQSLENLVNN